MKYLYYQYIIDGFFKIKSYDIYSIIF